MLTDYHNKYNNNEKVELLQELPKCDTETWTEQMLENCASTFAAEVVINLGFAKHTLSVKYNKMKHNEMRYACDKYGWHHHALILLKS